VNHQDPWSNSTEQMSSNSSTSHEKPSKLKKTKRKKIWGSDPAFLKAIRKLPCILCGSPPPTTASHIKTRGSGGKDEPFNVTPMCFDCHRYFEDNRRIVIMNKSYFRQYLKELGWEIWFQNNKLIMHHPKYNDKVEIR